MKTSAQALAKQNSLRFPGLACSAATGIAGLESTGT
jgi:hypothetical protein